ncbi:MAG: hypothetical protein AAB701_00705 [Patescibacteria group bacterium]
MEEILYLEADEEITSVIDKLDDLTGSTVALVVPKHAHLASSVVNLRLLLAEAKKRKKTIAIVTQDKIGTKLASQVGIPVYASVTDEVPVDPEIGPRPSIDDVIELEESSRPTTQLAQPPSKEPRVPVKRYDEAAQAPIVEPVTVVPAVPVEHTRTVESRSELPDRDASKSGPQRNKIRKVWFVAAALVSIAVLAGVGWWFYWGSWQAVAVLSLQSEPFQEKAEVVISNSIQVSDASQGQIPGQRVETQVSKSGSFPTTGKKDVGSKASGTMTISNRLGEPVALTSGTRFEQDGLVVVSTESVTVGAATVALDAQGNVTVKPGNASVPIEASASGDQYNLAPGNWIIASLTSAQRDKVTAANQAAFSGGLTKTVQIMTAEDIDAAKALLIQQSTEELLATLQQESQALTILKEGVAVEIVESSSDKQPNDETDSFNLTATVRARALGFVASEYRAMIVERVKLTVPTGKQLVVASDDAIDSSIVSVDVGQGQLKVAGRLHTRTVSAINQEELVKQITGKTVTEAQQQLSAQEGVLSANVTIRPSLRATLPTEPDRITLQLNGN